MGSSSLWHSPHGLLGVGNLVQGHAILLDGLQVLALGVVNVADIDTQPASTVKSLVFHQSADGIDGFSMHVASLIDVGEVDVDLVDGGRSADGMAVNEIALGGKTKR